MIKCLNSLNDEKIIKYIYIRSVKTINNKYNLNSLKYIYYSKTHYLKSALKNAL